MKVLVLGSSGQVGAELMREGWDTGTVVFGLARPEVDLTRPETIEAALAAHAPDIVVNTAAYTAVDRAETDRAAAFAVNSDGPERLASATAKRGVPLIHLSTDYVFDGAASRPYCEADPVAPINAYGLSKASGEAAVRLRQPQHIILRTAWVYASHGHNFVKTMLRLAGERDEVAVVADQRGSPTAAREIAGAVVGIVRCLGSARDSGPAEGIWGTFHFAAQGQTTWHGVAEHIFQHYGRVRGRRPVLRAITSGEYPTPARRPANSSLDCGLIRSVFGIVAPPWQTRLDAVLNELLPARSPRTERLGAVEP